MTKASPARVARKKAEKMGKDAPKTFTSEAGLEIEIKAVDPIFVQSVLRSVRMPPKPTYTTHTSSGREETFEMDEKAAEQTEGGKELWKSYQTALNEATQEQADRSMRAVFFEGTVSQAVADPSWERKMRIIGIQPSFDKDERWVDYLLMSLSMDDVISLANAIMAVTGVDEELIEAAEESFRGSLQPESEEPDGPEGNPEQVAGGAVAT